MKWQRSHKKQFEEINEHDQPTEPQPAIPRSPVKEENAPPSGLNPPPAAPVYVPASPPQSSTSNTLPPSIHPTLTPPLASNRPAATVHPQPKRRLIPTLVGLLFLAIQLLLFVRLIFKFLTIPGQAATISMLSTFSDYFLVPIQLFLHSVTLPISLSATVQLLLAILLYGILARILVRLLKALFHAR